MNRSNRTLAATLVGVAGLTALVGCSPTPPTVAPPSPPAVRSSTAPTTAPPASGSPDPASPAAEPASAAPDEPTGPPNDLASGALKRTIKSGGLTFTVRYQASTPVEHWTSTGPKSIRVSLTASDDRRGRQKVYLTRSSLRFAVADDSGELPGPDPIVDTANLNPGYLVRTPYSYQQAFAIPVLDDGARSVQLDFKFEVVSLVDSKAKDYTKQTASDTVRIVLGS